MTEKPTTEGAEPERHSQSAADKLPTPKRPISQSVSPERQQPFPLDDREKKFALYIESRFERRMINIIRQESGDSYAGLPADHVLINLDKAFPDVNFPARMMARLEAEQAGRLEHERRQDDLERYEAETRRLDATADRKHLSTAANRALLALIILLLVGVLLTVLGFQAAGITVLGTTLLGVIGAFLRQQLRAK